MDRLDDLDGLDDFFILSSQSARVLWECFKERIAYSAWSEKTLIKNDQHRKCSIGACRHQRQEIFSFFFSYFFRIVWTVCYGLKCFLSTSRSKNFFFWGGEENIVFFFFKTRIWFWIIETRAIFRILTVFGLQSLSFILIPWLIAQRAMIIKRANCGRILASLGKKKISFSSTSFPPSPLIPNAVWTSYSGPPWRII